MVSNRRIFFIEFRRRAFNPFARIFQFQALGKKKAEGSRNRNAAEGEAGLGKPVRSSDPLGQHCKACSKVMERIFTGLEGISTHVESISICLEKTLQGMETSSEGMEMISEGLEEISRGMEKTSQGFEGL